MSRKIYRAAAIGRTGGGNYGHGLHLPYKELDNVEFIAVAEPAAVYLTRILKSIIGISIGESIGFLPILYSSFLILLPVSVSHGALFTFSCRIHSIFFARDASSIGKVYVYETVGTIFGGIVWTYLLIPYLHVFQMAVGLAMLNFPHSPEFSGRIVARSLESSAGKDLEV